MTRSGESSFPSMTESSATSIAYHQFSCWTTADAADGRADREDMSCACPAYSRISAAYPVHPRVSRTACTIVQDPGKTDHTARVERCKSRMHENTAVPDLGAAVHDQWDMEPEK